VQKQLTTANTTVAQLQEQKKATEERNQALKEEIKYVTQNWIAPGKAAPQPLPACVFTDGFVRVYNQSITANSSAVGVSAAAYSPGIQSQAETAATIKASSDLQPSNLERADILQHITSYGARCQDIESQLNQLLDYLEQQGTN
jgi:septation ring formation regulator EzrA